MVTGCDYRSKLSISPDESWLPIASILVCILHIQVKAIPQLFKTKFLVIAVEIYTLCQLEASIKNGDLENFQLFKRASRNASTKKDSSLSEQKVLSTYE